MFTNKFELYDFKHITDEDVFSFINLPKITFIKDDTIYQQNNEHFMKLPITFHNKKEKQQEQAFIPLLYPPPFQYTRQLIQDSPFNDSLSCSGMCSVENSKKEMWERSCDTFGEAQCTFETNRFPAEYISDRIWYNN